MSRYQAQAGVERDDVMVLALMADEQDHGHQQVNHDGRSCGASGGRDLRREYFTKQVRQQGAAKGIDKAHQQGAHKGAPNGPNAANHNDHKGQDQNAFAHAHLHRQQGPEHGPRDGTHGCTQAKHQGEQALDVDAHGHGHVTVGRAGPHPRTHAGLGHHQVQKQGQGQSHADDDEPVTGVLQAR